MPPFSTAAPAARPPIIPRARPEGHAPGEALTVRAEATFRGRLPAFAEVRAWAEAFGAAVGADRSAALRLVLVLEELFTNTVAHGYAGRYRGPDLGHPRGRGRRHRGDLRGRGPGLRSLHRPPATRADRRPPGEAPPGGLGLALVRGLSASARYARVGERNRITLDVPPEARAPPQPPPVG